MVDTKTTQDARLASRTFDFTQPNALTERWTIQLRELWIFHYTVLIYDLAAISAVLQS